MIRNALDVVPFATVKGILVPKSENDKEKLV